MDGYINNLVEGMFRFIGRTVTIFTTSGGLSGSGFTGVLLSVDCNVVRLLVDEGAAPACPVGSSCTGCMTPMGMNNFGFGNGFGWGNGWGNGWNNWGGFNGGCGCDDGGNPLGAVCVIPTMAIACFTHNAI
ncbi:MAG: hypothetical protein FWF44_02660 [Defluviitaleaceae bacterium]|nr:hypothetical protein [Defluviitaleaceae bacterium]